MTDKERLNEIENRYEYQKETAEYAGISMILGDYEFLMQQAKRVQELEETVNDYRTANKCLHERRIECGRCSKRYKQAMQNAINACKYTNPEVAYILQEALEGEE